MALTAYLDATGSEHNPVLTVGGFLSPDRICKEIDSEWRDALGDRGPFRFAEFGSKSCALGSQDWSPSQRVQFLKRLAHVVNRFGNQLLSVSADVSQYDAATPAYAGCAQMCFGLAEAIVGNDRRRDPHEEDRLTYVFEDGDRSAELSNAFEEFLAHQPHLRTKRSIRFAPKFTTLLQPTDLVTGMIQEVLLKAYSRGSLAVTDDVAPVDRFERYYAFDGTSTTILTGAYRKPLCFVANKQRFADEAYRLAALQQLPALK